MLIEIKGGSKRQKELLRSMVIFCAKQMMTPRMINSLSINIELKKNLYKNEDAYGLCIWEGSNIRPKEFTISIDKDLKQIELVKTVCHEMVHVKQWANRELFDYLLDTDYSRFNGELINTSKMNYFDYPWEIEAYGREVGLLIRWVDENKYNNYKWVNG